MISRRSIAALALLCAATSAHAQTGSIKTPSALNSEINTLFSDNTSGAITPFDVRQVALDQVASVPFLNTANTFSAFNTFSQAPAFSSLTGYVKAVGASAATASATIPTTDLTGFLQAANFPTLTGDVTASAGAVATTIANNAVTNAKAAQMAAYTLKGNATGSTANQADVDVTALTLKASPVSGDIVLIQDSAASNAMKRTTVGALASAGSVGSYNGRTGAVTALGTDVPLRGYISGLTLSTAGSSQVFATSAGVTTDSTGTSMMSLPAFTKTAAGGFTWTLGSGGSALDIGAGVTASAWYHVFVIQRPDTGVVDELFSLAPGTSSTVTITNASPGIVTWTAHGLQANTPVVFTTTGALPTGLTAGTQYFVKTVVSADTFSVSATQGGAAINTSSAGSGTHTATSSPVMPTNYTLYRRIGSIKTDGSSNWTSFYQNGDTFIWSTMPALDYNPTNPGTSAVTISLTSVPPGVRVELLANAMLRNAGSAISISWLLSSLDIADTAPNIGASPLGTLGENVGATATIGSQARVWTNPSAQIRSRLSSSDANTTLYLQTTAWKDLRGTN